MSEAVLVRMELATLRRRFAALLVDGAVLILFSIPATLFLGWGSAESTVFNVGLGAVYHVASLSYWSATPGKKLLGIFVSDPDGVPIHFDRAGVFRTAGLRYLFSDGIFVLGFISPLLLTATSLVPVVSLVMALTDSQKRTLHDRVATTLVLRGSADLRTDTEEG